MGGGRKLTQIVAGASRNGRITARGRPSPQGVPETTAQSLTRLCMNPAAAQMYAAEPITRAEEGEPDNG